MSSPTGTEARVCADIAERQKRGEAKYGTTVERSPLFLRDWLRHAYEECLDQAIYLRRAMEVMDGDVPPFGIVSLRGKQWFPHVPGDPMPCDARVMVVVVMRHDEERACDGYAGAFIWGKIEEPYSASEIIAWRPADAADSLQEKGAQS